LQWSIGEAIVAFHFKVLTPMLQTADMDETIAWYVSVLGFRCVAREGQVWCRLERGAVALMFMRNDQWGEPFATATQCIYVDDVAALWADIKDRVTAAWGPERMPDGMVEFAIKDPSGYLLSFGQSVPVRRSPALQGPGAEDFAYERIASTIKSNTTDQAACHDRGD
jgi:catechol 2,3-dioxygenase-like lactoylglutathione lyase family enzyme